MEGKKNVYCVKGKGREGLTEEKKNRKKGRSRERRGMIKMVGCS